jgi:molecular chaperone GrpE
MNNTDLDAEKQGNEDPSDTPEPLARLDTDSITPEQLDELKQRAAKADEHWDRLLRTTADLENYRKRAAREKQEAIRYANESLLEKLMPILDNFDMALSAAQNNQTGTAQSLQQGISMIFQQFRTVLRDAGLEEIDALGKAFDPHLHEAIAQQENTDVVEGQVLQQVRKGYKLRERLLRPASVIVAKMPHT